MMDANTTISIVGGSVSVAAIVIAFVTWSLKRNVAHEDEWKKAAETRDAARQKEIDALRQQLHHREVKDSEERGKLTNLTGTIGTLQGAITQLGVQLETNRDRMSQFYRNELEKHEKDTERRLERMEAALVQRVEAMLPRSKRK